MQRLMRAAAVTRTHFDGDAVPFGVYTAPAAAWVRHTGLEPRTSRPQAGLLLTSLSLALDRIKARRQRLNEQVASVMQNSTSALIVGGGLTGVELAAECVT